MDSFADFPDDYQTMYKDGLAYFYYQLKDDFDNQKLGDRSVETLLNQGILRLEPIVYEDFLPVSAAGIFQSNLGDDAKSGYNSSSNQAIFEQSLGSKVYDECELYQSMMDKSLAECLAKLG